MASAIEWVRGKAKPLNNPAEPLEWEGKTYQPVWTAFKGQLPYRMRQELRKASLVQTATEYETLRCKRSGSGHETGEVEYARVIYVELA